MTCFVTRRPIGYSKLKKRNSDANWRTNCTAPLVGNARKSVWKLESVSPFLKVISRSILITNFDFALLVDLNTALEAASSNSEVNQGQHVKHVAQMKELRRKLDESET
jgi:hypothetical protein